MHLQHPLLSHHHHHLTLPTSQSYVVTTDVSSSTADIPRHAHTSPGQRFSSPSAVTHTTASHTDYTAQPFRPHRTSTIGQEQGKTERPPSCTAPKPGDHAKAEGSAGRSAQYAQQPRRVLAAAHRKANIAPSIESSQHPGASLSHQRDCGCVEFRKGRILNN